MIYNEGFEIKFDNLRLFLFSFYSKKGNLLYY